MTIPYSRQSVNKEDVASVKKVLKSDFLTQGPEVEKFESALKKNFNSKFCTVVNSATSGLYLACRAAEISKKDIVWTSINTFVSTANVVVHCGAKVEFLDINFDGNIEIKKLEKKLIKAKKSKKLPKALIVVHFAGLSCEMDKIFNLSKKYDFKIIEDASHAVGSEYKGHKVGSCKYSDFCVFSFHAIKSITTGEGGAVLSKTRQNDEKIKLLRSPEGCASILWRDPGKSLEAAEAMKLSAQDLLKLGVIDDIIPEPLGGAHRNHDEIAHSLKNNILKNLDYFENMDPEQIFDHRKNKFLKIGREGGFTKPSFKGDIGLEYKVPISVRFKRIFTQKKYLFSALGLAIIASIIALLS